MKKITAEKCREQFQVWGESRRCELAKWVRGDRAGEYKNPVVEKMWQAWQASRDALPILEQQERGESEWLHWNGERALPPVNSYSRVEVRLRNGEVIERQAQEFAWRNSPVKVGFDIIAYRIIPEQPTNQNGEQ